MENWNNFKIGDTISFVNYKGINKSFVGLIEGKTLLTIDKHNLYIYKDFMLIRKINNSINLLIEKNIFNKKGELF